MVSSRVATALAGLTVSLLVSVVLWQVFDVAFFFLAVPFVPFLFRFGGDERTDRPPVRACPRCSFTTRDSEYEFCPRDGAELEYR
ncbi:hypothetical protein [Halobacterium zhouii]|uniref:hypothetical protein n=1 Tax=Halobacterium zhouii TaxID=2902624 RepID=UPI001E3AD23C|nr:hypothetical protein [Halobacterium zhouii]